MSKSAVVDKDFRELNSTIERELIRKFPRDLLRENRLLPYEENKNTIYFITEKRPPLTVIDDLTVFTDCKVKIKLGKGKLVSRLIEKYLEAPLTTVKEMAGDLAELSSDEFGSFMSEGKVENLEELARETPIVKMVNTLITTALKDRASDIHLEPYEDSVKVRYRIDGVLYEKPAPPKKLLPAVVTRIKIMSNLDIAEHRRPQDGRIRIKVLGRELDIRVSIIPTLYGESVVLRLLDRAEKFLKLSNLGLSECDYDNYATLIKQSQGIILVTGPTGSGKTTTLYATLNKINSSAKKIITIEDPVEYQLNGITQIQVKPEINFSFARGLRSILRQDPDIIMVGEIRDLDTAEIAIQAALTGHLVLATLHTNNAVGAINRLLDMGIKDYLLADTLSGVMAQRLVRVLCSECKKKVNFEAKEYDYEGTELNNLQTVFVSRGCEKCNEIGFTGRTGIYELLTVDRKVAELIKKETGSNDLEQLVIKRNMNTLMDDGLKKVCMGQTTVKEVLRVSRGRQ